jgi:hypothetical protein
MTIARRRKREEEEKTRLTKRINIAYIKKKEEKNGCMCVCFSSNTWVVFCCYYGFR